MPAGFNRAILDSIKLKAGIIPYSTRLKNWKKLGDEYRALCPFHTDHNPSLSVYQDKSSKQWLYKCFGCGASGDILKLVCKTEGVNFLEAIKKISSEIDFPLSETTAENANGHEAYDWWKGTEELLANEDALKYLGSRGIGSAKLISQKRLGLMDVPRLGTSLVMPYQIDEATGKVTAKLRAIGDNIRPDLKWGHFSNCPTATLLFNEAVLDSFSHGTEPLFIVESELDCLMLEELGYRSVSVSSASACVKRVNGEEIITVESQYIDKIRDAHQVFILTDMDEAGEKCARLLSKAIDRPSKTFRLHWDYVKGSGQPKDIGELAKQFARNPEGFKARIAELRDEAINRPPEWRRRFRNPQQMDATPLREIILGILPEEGLTTVAGLSGHGKTLLALSMTKALVTGSPFLGKFEVEQPCQVLYLCPEIGEKSLRLRLKAFHLHGCGDELLCHTLSNGDSLSLRDCDVLQAAKGRVVVLDTAIRFIEGDENSAQDNNKGLAGSCFRLLEAGAKAVLCLHHSSKNFSTEKSQMTLENSHRGTGDFGAMASMSFAVKRIDAGRTLLHIENVKSRDLPLVRPFQVEGRPWIDRNGDFRLTAEPGAALSFADTVKKQEHNGPLDEARAHEKYAKACQRFEKNEPISTVSVELGIRKKTVCAMRKAWQQDSQADSESESLLSDVDPTGTIQ